MNEQLTAFRVSLFDIDTNKGFILSNGVNKLLFVIDVNSHYSLLVDLLMEHYLHITSRVMIILNAHDVAIVQTHCYFF